MLKCNDCENTDRFYKEVEITYTAFYNNEKEFLYDDGSLNDIIGYSDEDYICCQCDSKNVGEYFEDDDADFTEQRGE
jgi:hypothetical protein